MQQLHLVVVKRCDEFRASLSRMCYFQRRAKDGPSAEIGPGAHDRV
jgi:hypothetical protein